MHKKKKKKKEKTKNENYDCKPQNTAKMENNVKSDQKFNS